MYLVFSSVFHAAYRVVGGLRTGVWWSFPVRIVRTGILLSLGRVLINRPAVSAFGQSGHWSRHRRMTESDPKRTSLALSISAASKRPTSYSITSSAATRRFCGTVRPSVLAILRLMTNSNLVDCMTGSSAGFSPLRIRPV